VIHITTVTVEQILLWKPCDEYTHDIITGLFAGREQLSALDILELDIPAADKSWTVLREELIPANILHEFACRCAENALVQARKTGYELDPRGQMAIDAKRKWLRKEIADSELDAVWDRGWSLTWIATRDAARDVAMRAAKYATWIAIKAGGKVAARDMTKNAILENSKIAENKHLNTLKEMLESQHA